MESNSRNPAIVTSVDLTLDLIRRDVKHTLLDEFEFVTSPSKVTDGVRTIFMPSVPADHPSLECLEDGRWKEYEAIIFASHWQQQMYNLFLDIPYGAGIVLRNAIDTVPNKLSRNKPKNFTTILYVGEMNRGLDLAHGAFKKLTRKMHENARMIVVTNLTNSEEMTPSLQALSDEIRDNPKVSVFRDATEKELLSYMQEAHIFVYPTDYPEMSYTPLLKAISAGCMCIHSSTGSFPEMCLGVTSMYGIIEDRPTHGVKFLHELENALNVYANPTKRERLIEHLNTAKHTVDAIYSWKRRKEQWEDLLKNLLTSSS